MHTVQTVVDDGGRQGQSTQLVAVGGGQRW